MSNEDRDPEQPPLHVVLRPAVIPPHERGAGVRTIPLVSRKLGATAFINGITEFEPGAALQLHSHNCEESVVVLEGRAIVEIDSVEHELGPQDTTFLPSNIPHRFRNPSRTERLRIFWTYGSIHATRRIMATGEVRSIDAEYSGKPA